MSNYNPNFQKTISSNTLLNQIIEQITNEFSAISNTHSFGFFPTDKNLFFCLNDSYCTYTTIKTCLILKENETAPTDFQISYTWEVPLEIPPLGLKNEKKTDCFNQPQNQKHLQ